MKNEVCAVGLDKRFRHLERGIEDAAHFFLKKLNKSSVYLEVYLVGNVRMRKLNKKYLNKDYPTNVLAFNASSGFPGDNNEAIPVGEIYLNPPYIKEHGEDIRYLLLHGLLHLFGFNHENKSDRIRMEKLEGKLMQWLNHKS